MPTMPRKYEKTGRPPGRPKKDPGEATEFTGMRLRAETRAALAAAAEARGQTMDQVISAALAALAREAIAPDA
jgi:uncharacterized protein (DUF1778 family)